MGKRTMQNGKDPVELIAEIVSLKDEGYSIKEIAKKLGISEFVVRKFL